ncbi:MAG: SpoIID/LytB domain-containing protein [Patescibacteria group bacterium]
MKKLVCFLALFCLASYLPIQAAECQSNCQTIEECGRLIDDCSKVLGLYESANLTNKNTLSEFDKQIKSFESMIASAGQQIKQLENDIIDQEADLEVQKILLGQRVRRLYKYQRGQSFLVTLLAAQNNAQFLRNLVYQQLIANEDRKLIGNLDQELGQLNQDKKSLDEKQNWLTQKKQESENQANFYRQEVKKAEDYIGQLSSTIASLSSKQKNLLNARSGTFTSSVGDVPISSIACSGPPGSPSFCDPGGGNWFGAFSFGAWTHRKGMSQYGAKGRADNGQNSSQILQAYYGKTPEGKDTGGNISVTGYGELNFEDYYLMGIAEMPSSWNKEALKAQAIAARSYAYRYKSQGSAICTTEACQVFSKSKADSPPESWKQAVNETRGQVIEGVVTYYSSTSGGYLTTSGWDTTDGQGGSGFASRAWESKGGSPWFYSSWFTQTYNSGSAKCNRSHPWLNETEMADILNAWLVGNDDRILPTTINQCPIAGVSGNPYSIDELKNKANEKGGAFTSVSSSSVTYSNDGSTSSITFNTNKGSVTISGSEFKQAFNLGAPGYIAIRSPLFNIEKK